MRLVEWSMDLGSKGGEGDGGREGECGVGKKRRGRGGCEVEEGYERRGSVLERGRWEEGKRDKRE
jgi:hypothetical protein